MKLSIWPAIGLSLLVLSSCKHDTAQDEALSTFALSDTMMARIQVDTVKEQPVKSELKLSGKVVPDENKVVHIFPLVSGNVEAVHVNLGDHVTKGQVLATIKSGEIAEFERQYTDARLSLQLAEKNLKVAQDMFAAKLNAEKDVIAARKEVESAQAEVNRVKEVYQIYSIGSASDYVVKAPMSGYITEKNINPGMQIRTDNGENMFTLAQLDEVYITAKIYETDIAKVKEGFDAVIYTISYPDMPFKGNICNLYRVLDPESKTMKARIRLNPSPNNSLLKPEMYATVNLYFDEGMNMLAIPASAVIFDRSKNFVMVFKDRYNIDTRGVEVYKTLNGISYIKNGLKAGEKVISKNQLLIYDALND